MVWEKIKEIEIEGVKYYTKYNIRNEGENVLVCNVPVDMTDKDVLLGIAKNPGDNNFFAKITNVKQKRPYGIYVPSATAITAGTVKDLQETQSPNWKEWLKPPDTAFYDSLVMMESSHYCEWEVRLPKASSIGGLKSSIDEDRRYTKGDLVHLITTKQFFPGFKLWNQSQSTLTFARAYTILIFAYEYVKIKSDNIPDYYEPIIIGDVTDT